MDGGCAIGQVDDVGGWALEADDCAGEDGLGLGALLEGGELGIEGGHGGQRETAMDSTGGWSRDQASLAGCPVTRAGFTAYSTVASNITVAFINQ